jgi:hypothetical protein
MIHTVRYLYYLIKEGGFFVAFQFVNTIKQNDLYNGLLGIYLIILFYFFKFY